MNTIELIIITFGIIIGIIIGATIIFIYFKVDKKQILSRMEQQNLDFQKRIETIIQAYDDQISRLKLSHLREIEKARVQSVDASRFVLKAKMAETIAALLPGFEYLPSDCRFIGDPIDYIIFKGYTELKDHGEKDEVLEVVLLEIKQGNAALSKGQRAIKKAINDKRISFKEVRISDNGDVKFKDQQSGPEKRILRTLSPNENNENPLMIVNEDSKEAKENYLNHIRLEYPSAYMKWTESDDELLRKLFLEGDSIKDLANCFKRQPGAIKSRIRKFGYKISTRWK
jgi:predicted Holliday junction resolvase-like endonuclease